MKWLLALAALVVAAAGARSARAAEEQESPWPAPVPGWTAPQGGEHPRLFFRRADLADLKKRAATPEGQAILKRLRFLLNGGDGESMPKVKRPLDAPYGDQSQPIDLEEGAYSMSHAAGFGFLYQLTGQKKYADLGRECFEWAFQGVRDRDGKARYSFRKPTGALRAGPSLGWYAAGYDLCYDGWDEGFRRKVALELANYNEGPYMSLAELARGSRLSPSSNHWGPQIGGAALALLAVKGDPGTDDKKISELLEANAQAILTQMTQGWSADGWFSQGDGAGCISSDNALIPGIQAWRVAGGRDFVAPRPNVQWMTLKWVMGTVPVGGRPEFPSRGMYPHNVWARGSGSGGGLSGCGTFAQGFGALEDRTKPALLWLYNHGFREADEKAGAPFDTPSPYPHRAILALVNWPFGMAEKNPADVLGRVHGPGSGYLFARNQWKDETDLMVSFRASQIYPIIVIGYGMKLEFGKLPGATFTYYKEEPDGSLVVSNPKGGTYVAVDFSRRSGAELLLAILGKGAGGGKDNQGKGASVKFTQVKLGDQPCDVRTWQTGAPPEVKCDGQTLSVGPRTIRFDGEKLILGP